MRQQYALALRGPRQKGVVVDSCQACTLPARLLKFSSAGQRNITLGGE